MMLRRRLIWALLNPPTWSARSGEKEREATMPRPMRNWERRKSSLAGEDRAEMYNFK